MADELITAEQAAAERGVSESRMRDLIAIHQVPAVARQPGRTGRNLYRADQLRDLPPPARGERTDLTAERVGALFAAARAVADTRGHRDEHDKIWAQCVDGNPAAVPMIAAAVLRWTKRVRGPDVSARAAEVGRLAGEVGELPAKLPPGLRSRIVVAEAKARRATPEMGAPGS